MPDPRPLYYVRDTDGNVRPAETLKDFAAMLGDERRRRVAHTLLAPDVRISTVFLGIDHNHTDDGPPLLYETMIFGGDFDREQVRYTDEDEALAGHDDVVARVWAWLQGEPVYDEVDGTTVQEIIERWKHDGKSPGR
jgi:hypothetical protein